MDMDKFQSFLLAFMVGENRRAAQIAQEMMAQSAPHFIARLCLVAEERAGTPQPALVVPVGRDGKPDYNVDYQTAPFELLLFAIVQRQVHRDVALARATTDDERCQANFYIACQLITDHSYAEADRYLATSVARPSQSYEHMIAAGEYAESQRARRRVLHAQDLFSAGRYEEAVTAARAAYDFCRTYLGETDNSYIASLNILAAALKVLKRPDEAVPFAERIFEITSRLPQRQPGERAVVQLNLAALQLEVGRYELAQALARAVIDTGFGGVQGYNILAQALRFLHRAERS